MQSKAELRRRGYRLTKTRKTAPGLPMELIGKSGTVLPTRRKKGPKKSGKAVSPLNGAVHWLMTNYSYSELLDLAISHFIGGGLRAPFSDQVFEAAIDQIIQPTGA